MVVLSPSTFEYEIVTVDPHGKVRDRQKRRAEWRTEELGDDISLDLVRIPAGTFMMGSPDDEVDRKDPEGPQHSVSIAAFWMGKYPVTQAQWKAVANLPKVTRYLDPDPAKFKGDNRPVEWVEWYAAEEFCKRLSRQTEREYRLPSEAEWEYACRAGATTPFHFGETLTPDLANYGGDRIYGSGPKREHCKQTMPVGSFEAANAFGLYDMHGNVGEWCLDHWHENYQGAPADGGAWLSSSEMGRRIFRGGAWDYDPRICRSAHRDWNGPVIRLSNVGFRVCCSSPRSLL
ncbi:MAG: formylglycine-generating enzyme family protein [Leptolyngbyaceae cyanobacterium MO_188.B28]|nr:formylglycine-generating enzyme family protein [Leptolyngbyaceae cyanobacterium MO_188.B28]